MEAVMILKNSEPTWGEAKRQLSDVNFINTVRDNVATGAQDYVHTTRSAN